jgi:hypothetical protein
MANREATPVWEDAGGVLLSLPLLFIALVDKSGTFFDYMYENLSNIPNEVVLAGLVSAYLYYLLTDKMTIYARAASTWLDLVQQFFCLGAGAFWILQVARLLRTTVTRQGFLFEWKELLLSFGMLLLGATVASIMSSLRDTPIIKPVRLMCHVAVVAGGLLLLILLRTGEERVRSTQPVCAPSNTSISGAVPPPSLVNLKKG